MARPGAGGAEGVLGGFAPIPSNPKSLKKACPRCSIKYISYVLLLWLLGTRIRASRFIAVGSASSTAPSTALAETSSLVFAALGGSNSLGVKGMVGESGYHTSFATLMVEALRDDSANYTFLSGGIGGMGPELAAACASKFMPPNVRVVTLEYLPNLGWAGSDLAELAGFEALLGLAYQRGARVWVINIVPCEDKYLVAGCLDGVIGCTTRQHVEQLRAELDRLASAYSAKVITVDCNVNRSLFGDDVTHLTQVGHALVFEQMWRMHHEPTAPRDASPVRPTHSTSDIGIACYLGDELSPLLRNVTRFARVDLARGAAPKIGWEALERGARLTICNDLPRAMGAIGAWEMGKLQKTPVAPLYTGMLGVQISHRLNLPLFGVIRLDCHGACRCDCMADPGVSDRSESFDGNCSFDTLVSGRVSVTHFLRVVIRNVVESAAARLNSPCDAGQCALSVSNSEDADEKRIRVVLRALMISHQVQVAGSEQGFFDAYQQEQSGISNL